MPPMTSQSTFPPLWAVNPFLLFLTALLFAHAHPASSASSSSSSSALSFSDPFQQQRRHSSLEHILSSSSSSSPSAPIQLQRRGIFFPVGHPHSSSSSSSASSPIRLQRRQSFFRCTGWGAGCSNLDYNLRQPGYARAPSRRYPVGHSRVARPTRVRAAASTSKGSRDGGYDNYGLHFLFTSGTTWGANGKRSSDVRSAHNDVIASRLLDVIREVRKRGRSGLLQ